MNIALLTAAGIGSRMGQTVPKQFMTVNDKPIIIYTLEAFQKHPLIDAIAVICLDKWENFLRTYAVEFGITKLKWIFKGGNTNQESLYNGIKGLKEADCADDSVILVHDGVRPLIPAKLITDNIDSCLNKGNAVTGIDCKEVIMEKDNDYIFSISYPREKLIRTQTPHTFFLKDLLKAHEDSIAQKLTNTVAPCDMMGKLYKDKKQNLVQGSELNFKITTQEDLIMFKNLLTLGVM